MDLPKKILEELEEKTKDFPEDVKQKIYEEVKKRYEKALADVGEPVGLVSTQSLTEPATQMILRSFHFIGMSELQLSLGLPRFIEIADGRKKIKEKYMVIRLKDEYKQNKEVAYQVARKLKEIKLFDVVKEIQTDIINKTLKIIFNLEELRDLDLSVEKVTDILKKKLKKMKIIEAGEDYITLKAAREDMSMKEFYQYKEKIKSLHIAEIKGIRDVLVKMENGEFVIYTYGSNLKEVMKIPEVDYTKVYSNDIHEVAKVLGIEAAREVIVREILNILEKQGLDVDVRHVLLLADVLTWYGEYLGVTRYGLQAEKGSALARAAFETPIKHLIVAAMLGENDDMKTAIENVMTNQPIPYGTGLFKVFYVEDPKKEKQER
ncbi:MAG TPA: DNA-directed RNA polymerase subunit A'' [Hydrogenothermaceae bacterium]|nr:DNA-directed RNA polymerase subunit A'' [Hydrogenothermaceae bacterium]HIP90522.1 DNA-directed RNA polymerase subunit A'' [Candidatus Nanopusillus sp.]